MGECPKCATENPAGARFCNGCGAALGATPAPAREERKTVTILFADLAGFTARSEMLDPEDVRAILIPYYEALTAEVTAHGGGVDRFLGDGIMALFGAPVAHEDDPERAVRAALRIVERVPALGLDLHVRVGINTGPVLFAAAEGTRDDSVTGDAVNTAARLQAAAPTDGVVVGEAAVRATSHLFRYEELPPITAKGKAEPVALWRALGTIAREVPEHVETTPFVGRDLERSLLVGVFDRARAGPATEFVTIVADPGMGKSRLVRELARYVKALPDLVTWRVGRCLPYGDGIGLWALGEIVKSHAGILDTDDQATLAAKLDAVLVEPDPSMRNWMADRLAPLVGLRTATDPPQREEAFTAWRRFLESIARTGPTLLVVEDLHWADDTLIGFLDHLADHTAGLPLLLVTTARPELEERHPAWLSRTRRSTVLSLAALPDGAMASLVAGSLPGASNDLVATVLSRAAGSPLYAEQLAAMLRERSPDGGGTLDGAAIPASMGALLAARIDALPPDAKAVLLDASVVGKTFWSGAVVALSGRERAAVESALAELVHRELVRPVFPSTMAGEAEYAFVHALLRDVAYGELTRRARLAHHRAAAAWIVERAGAAIGEDAEIVVAHLEQALDLATVTGETGEAPAIKATLVDALLAAADAAMRTEVQRAVGLLRRVIALLAVEDERRPTALARLGHALLATSDYAEAAAALDEAAGSLRALGEDVAAAVLGAPLAIALAGSGEAERGEAVLAASRTVLERHPGPGLVSILADEAVGRSIGEHADASERAEEALEVAASLGLPVPHRALMVRGMGRFDAGGVWTGEADMRASIEAAVVAGDLRAAAVASHNFAATVREVHGAAVGRAAFDDAIAFRAAHGIPTEPARSGRLAALLSTGEWDELLSEAASLRAWAMAHGDAWSAFAVDVATAWVRVERGEASESPADLVAAARDIGQPLIDAAAVSAFAAATLGDLEASRRVLAEALAASTAGESTEPTLVVRACLRAAAPELARTAIAMAAPQTAPADLSFAAAMIAELGGDLESARAGYERAIGALEQRGDVYNRTCALTGLGRCLLAADEMEAGVARLRESRVVWTRLRATPRIAEIDVMLAAVGTAPEPDPGALPQPSPGTT